MRIHAIVKSSYDCLLLEHWKPLKQSLPHKYSIYRPKYNEVSTECRFITSDPIAIKREKKAATLALAQARFFIAQILCKTTSLKIKNDESLSTEHKLESNAVPFISHRTMLLGKLHISASITERAPTVRVHCVLWYTERGKYLIAQVCKAHILNRNFLTQ